MTEAKKPRATFSTGGYHVNREDGGEIKSQHVVADSMSEALAAVEDIDVRGITEMIGGRHLVVVSEDFNGLFHVSLKHDSVAAETVLLSQWEALHMTEDDGDLEDDIIYDDTIDANAPEIVAAVAGAGMKKNSDLCHEMDRDDDDEDEWDPETSSMPSSDEDYDGGLSMAMEEEEDEGVYDLLIAAANVASVLRMLSIIGVTEAEVYSIHAQTGVNETVVVSETVQNRLK